MAGDGFASLPKPPYYAVIFSSQRNAYDDAGYGAMAERMVELLLKLKTLQVLQVQPHL